MKKSLDYIGVAVGAMIFNSKGELFLTKRGKKATNERGCWEIPGGSVELGEKLQDAAKREVKEEYGIDIILLEQFPAANHLIPLEKQHWVPTTFLARIKQGQTPKIMEPDKCDVIGWFPLDKLPSPMSIITKIDLKYFRRTHKVPKYEYFLASRVRNKTQVDDLLAKLRNKGKTVYWCMESDEYHKNDPSPEATMKDVETAKNWRKNPMISFLFKKDLKALRESEKLIMLLPLLEGKSVHLEAGIAYGMGKTCILIGEPEKVETLYRIFDEHYKNIDQFIASLSS